MPCARSSLIVGDNEPYAGALEGDCVHKHATMRGLANALIEVRQDLIRDEAGQAEWARAGLILRRILANSRADTTFHADSAIMDHVGRAPHTRSAQAGGGMGYAQIDPKLEVELEAAAFRRLVAHLRQRTDAQNIDLMNLAGFCRNCLANWYQEAAIEKGIDVEGRSARAGVRHALQGVEGAHQAEASTEQLGQFEAAHKNH